ncbi:hypothetical protein ASF40_19990 [Microbacterium sp. Leaf288]|uniref:HNH endonuclease n=1 Tax=Microbacterium sp. Leaf288 TaxID=1736323 RepID=UPI0006F90161|nr:HNH endonuclease [Microbacterium sp. Leaf288]KQP67814.1 hypothetical protein ASF40_19990 [Microbacterium sp. Leaf288]
MAAVLTIDLADVDRYADALNAAAKTIVTGDVVEAREVIGPIAFERWEGRLRYAAKAGSSSDTVERRARDVTDRIRAQVFLRDEMACTYCGGRCIPRNVLVAFSELFPRELPYHPNYRRGAIHPMYWALAPEADHTLAHARGGTGDIANLTTLHTMCNARKSDSLLTELPTVDRPEHVVGWDGLLDAYPSIVALGNSHGRRHAAAGYHRRWLRHFSQESV